MSDDPTDRMHEHLPDGLNIQNVQRFCSGIAGSGACERDTAIEFRIKRTDVGQALVFWRVGLASA